MKYILFLAIEQTLFVFFFLGKDYIMVLRNDIFHIRVNFFFTAIGVWLVMTKLTNQFPSLHSELDLLPEFAR